MGNALKFQDFLDINHKTAHLPVDYTDSYC